MYLWDTISKKCNSLVLAQLQGEAQCDVLCCMEQLYQVASAHAPWEYKKLKLLVNPALGHYTHQGWPVVL